MQMHCWHLLLHETRLSHCEVAWKKDRALEAVLTGDVLSRFEPRQCMEHLQICLGSMVSAVLPDVLLQKTY